MNTAENSNNNFNDDSIIDQEINVVLKTKYFRGPKSDRWSEVLDVGLIFSKIISYVGNGVVPMTFANKNLRKNIMEASKDNIIFIDLSQMKYEQKVERHKTSSRIFNWFEKYNVRTVVLPFNIPNWFLYFQKGFKFLFKIIPECVKKIIIDRRVYNFLS